MSVLSKASIFIKSTAQQLDIINRTLGTVRPQVISPDLCDDIIRRLAPSLKPYVGCDIIDINPGICLWSSKIHELVKPRRHILVEPQESWYTPWIRPLLDVPDTRYHLAHFERESDIWDYEQYKDKGLLPEQGDEPAGSTSVIGKGKILVLANLGRYTRHVKKSAATKKLSESLRRVYEFSNRYPQTASSFHNHGPARLLVWMLDLEKTSFLPRTISLRRRYTVLNERSCYVEEIAGSVLLSNSRQREASIELESCIATAKRMSLNGISIPSSRLDEMPRRLREDGEEAVREAMVLNEADGNRQWQRELFELQKAFANGEKSQFIGGPPGYVIKGKTNVRRKFTPEFKRFKALETNNNSALSRKAVIDGVLKLDEKIRQLEKALALDTSLDHVQRVDRSRDLDLAIARYRELLAKQTDRRLSQALFVADDRAAWNPDHPLLLWDHRSAEPIITRPDEFYHPRPLALLDFEPQSTPLSTLTDVQQSYLEGILLSIFVSPTLSVGDALNRMAPGAAEALIPQAPSLQDPLRGGRRDVDQLRVRVLTLEMIRELAVAWDNWKYSPRFGELFQKFS
ncbi:hypothetical protein MMC30_003852 [Trapelia coarctata]|nr:hypothetical protein [Trapelia coarctata]